MAAFISLTDVVKTYKTGEIAVKAAAGVTFDVDEGEFALIVGESGAGKTTVLNILGGMETCDSGNVIVDGVDISNFGEKELTLYRRYDIGFVFQFYNLVQNLTALENIEISSGLSKNPHDALTALRNVGLEKRAGHFPSGLSGGEQQRVSIARAIAKNPKLLLCDEPTGALDYITGKQVLIELQNTCKRLGKTILVITHNQAIIPIADRVIRMKNGIISSVKTNTAPVPVSEIEW